MTFPNSYIFLVGTIMLCMVTIQVFAENKEFKTQKSKMKNSFVSMLGNIIKANEKRINVLKKITELQDYVVPHDGTKFVDELEELMEFTDNDSHIIAPLDVMHNHKHRRRQNIKDKNKNGIILYLLLNNAKINRNGPVVEKYIKHKHRLSLEERHEGDKLNIEVDENTKGYKNKNNILNTLLKLRLLDSRRRGYMNTCNKAAAKACRKACINACKSFCRMYSCSRRAKKSFKTECKYSCKSKFKSNKYSDTE